ncbi:hypothetical protein PSHT_02688 [Puccinia striiformis]|uniref:Uncharacterized protein n=1 Tax=Puccinia striiformis TaxID=27350 RepID=A0A2S4WHF9_9BASI|nr:hypothetical protein PSHT_02688 [Puccinia striiformis]
MKTIRSLNHDILTSGLPAGVDPFAYVSHLNSVTWMPPLSTGTMVFLAVLLVFHVLVAAACSIILLLPYIGKTKRESCLRYTPLLVNTGIMMSIWEFLGSISTQMYLFLQIAIHVSPRLASRTQYGPAFSIMLICNIYSYWSTAHGFLTLSYTNKIFVDDSKNLRWLRSPLLINVSFITFPITLRILQATLSEGSLAWNQFQRTHSSDDQERISFEMAQAWAKADSSAKLFKTIAPLRDKFLLLRSAMLVFMLATTLVSLLSFDPVGIAWVIPKIGVQSVRSLTPAGNVVDQITQHIEIGLLGPSTRNCSVQRRTFARPTPNTKQSFFQTMRSDRQFFRLTMRAFAILLGILTGLTYWLLVSFHIDDVWLNPDWHGFMTWLPALSGSWAAVPLTLQSWRLYQDQKRPPVSSSEHKEDVIPVHIGQAPEGFTYNHDRLSEIKNLDQTSIS